MKKTLVLGVVGLMAMFASFSVAGCSDKTEENAAETAQSAGSDAARNTEAAGSAVGGAVAGAAKETQDAAQVMAWTAKAKNALIADPKIAAYKLNVDSSGEKDQVTVTGTVPSEAEKKRITEVVKKAVGPHATVDNKVTVSKM